MDVLNSRILLRPGDLDRSRRFYRDLLGLAIYREFGPPDDPGAVFFSGPGLLEVSGHSAGPAGRRVSAGRLGLRPGQDRSPAWVELPAGLLAPLPGIHHGRLAARLCRDRASYAADVGRRLEHRPGASTARTGQACRFFMSPGVRAGYGQAHPYFPAAGLGRGQLADLQHLGRRTLPVRPRRGHRPSLPHGGTTISR